MAAMTATATALGTLSVESDAKPEGNQDRAAPRDVDGSLSQAGGSDTPYSPSTPTAAGVGSAVKDSGYQAAGQQYRRETSSASSRASSSLGNGSVNHLGVPDGLCINGVTSSQTSSSNSHGTAYIPARNGGYQHVNGLRSPTMRYSGALPTQYEGEASSTNLASPAHANGAASRSGESTRRTTSSSGSGQGPPMSSLHAGSTQSQSQYYPHNAYNNNLSGGNNPRIHTNGYAASAHANNGNLHAGPSTPHQAGPARLPRPSEAIARELTQVLVHSFIPSILPTTEEYQVKETARKFLETLADRVCPGAKLLPFGSQANGMALRNSDMDLCYIGPPGQTPRPASELVEVLGNLIKQEAPTFSVKMLSRARIPIIKLEMPPTKDAPNSISCDIGFENRLALENTRLLLTYAMTDSRLRLLVLFLKVWTKRRKLNNPYHGTLSSYGYVLLVIHYLINVRKPAVLPNLQRLQPPSSQPIEKAEFEGRDIYFFDDLGVLLQNWQCTNRDSVGELLIGFFHHYQKEFRYNFDVVSIRTEGGILSKMSKGWHTDQMMEGDRANIPRNLNRLCIEDPFQTDYNVARTVTADGLFTIRGEIARAANILRSARHHEGSFNINKIISELVDDREDYIMQAPAQPTNRRRSAPSPRLQPTMMPNHQDFRNWAMAHGVPHAQSAGLPLYSHNLQATPLADDAPSSLNEQERAGLGSQVLSQANLQQLQYQQHLQVSQMQMSQQQILASLPALLASTPMRNMRGPQKRFHEHQYRPPRQSAHGHPTSLHHLSSAQSHFLHPMSSHPLAKSTGSNGLRQAVPPQLERRSSWDAGEARNGINGLYRGTSSVSEAGGAEIATAPTSPSMVGGMLPAFSPMPSVHQQVQQNDAVLSSLTSNISGVHNIDPSVFAGLERVARDQRRMGNSGGSGVSSRVPSRGSSVSNFRGRPSGRADGAQTIAEQAEFDVPVPSATTTIQIGGDQQASTSSNSESVQQVLSERPSSDGDAESRPAEVTLVTAPALLPQAGSIRFGNFDAAFYSSEPTELAGLGVFESDLVSEYATSPFTDAVSVALSVPEDLTLPSPRLPAHALTSSGVSKRGQKMPSPATDMQTKDSQKEATALPFLDSRRPSLHSRRRSAGDEAALDLRDVTFFGNIPVHNSSKTEGNGVVIALSKEGIPRDSRAESTSSSTTTADSSSLQALRNAIPLSFSSSASTTSLSISTSPTTMSRVESTSPITKAADRHEGAPVKPSKSRKSTSDVVLGPHSVPSAAVDPLSVATASKPQKPVMPSYASLAAALPHAKPKRRVGT